MDLRELVILILGLTIVGVVVRGLLVALKARKNQLRLAIDKNIPKDIDLDALELAELPSGGARVVRRPVDDAVSAAPDSPTKSPAAASAVSPVPAASESLAKPSSESLEDSAAPDELALHPANSSHASTASKTASIEENAEESAEESVEGSVDENVKDYAEENFDENLEESFEENAKESVVDRSEKASPFSISLGEGIDEFDEDIESDRPESPELPVQKVALSEVAADGEDQEETDEQENDEYSSITLSAGDRIGGENRRAKTAVRKESRGNSLFDSLSAAGKSLGALVSTRKSTEADLSSNSKSQSSVAETSLADDSAKVPDVESSALFEEYSQSDHASEAPSPRGNKSPKSTPPAVTDLFPETFEDLTAPSQFSGEADEIQIEEDSAVAAIPAKQAKSSIEKPSERTSKKTREQAQRKPLEKTRTKAQNHARKADEAVGADSTEQSGSSTGADAKPKTAVKPQQNSASDVTEVLVLNVTAKKGRLIMGERLLSLMEGLDLQFDERKIFSRRPSEAEGDALFSVANMLQPGTFDLNTMENFATVGVTLFLPLPAPTSSFEAFEEMLQTAQDLVRSIDGELRDDQRNMMTGQTIEHYRQRVRDFELRRLRSRAVAG